MTQEDMRKKVGPSVVEIFSEMKTDLGGVLPEEMCYGVVAGYLRGKGFNWEESLFGMREFGRTISACGVSPKESSGEFSIEGKGDGTVKVNIK